jgi:hypothetical protein
MANQFDIRRTAFANVTIPNVTTVTTISTTVSVPKGALITGIKFLAGDAVTISDMANQTANVYVGGLVLGSNNNILSAKVSAGSIKPIGLANTDGIVVTATGLLKVAVGSGTTANNTADFDLYVEYLYCDDNDTIN